LSGANIQCGGCKINKLEESGYYEISFGGQRGDIIHVSVTPNHASDEIIE